MTRLKTLQNSTNNTKHNLNRFFKATGSFLLGKGGKVGQAGEKRTREFVSPPGPTSSPLLRDEPVAPKTVFEMSFV